MIDRYSLPEMKKIWELEYKYLKWLDVEIAVCEAYALKGIIPHEAVNKIKERAKVDVNRILEIEDKVKHDIIAFLTSLSENIGEDSRYIHMGLTSSDILDTALALQLKASSDIILDDIQRLLKIIGILSIKYKDTLIMGRTHGVHAEPTSFGLKMLTWYTEMQRNYERMKRAKEIVSFGKISGAVGNYAHIDPWIEEKVCELLELTLAPVSTQIIQRDRHSEYCTTLAIIAASIEKFATEIRSLQRTEILELEEPFSEGQKGSSAMPHKRNPVSCEQLCGLARIVRANAIASLENIPLWHERDISHSSVERVILPDSTILLNYMLNHMIRIMENLNIYTERMKKNLDRTGGLIYSQRILLKLVEKGLSREKSYEIVQRNAMQAWREDKNFFELLSKDKDLQNILKESEIKECFAPEWYLRNVDYIYNRIKIE